MKKIEAIIRHERLERVKTALEEVGISGMTVSEVSGRGRQRGITLQWRAGDYRIDFLPKTKLEIIVDDNLSQLAIEKICEHAKTGKEGDGMIFVLPIESVVRVRTNDNVETCLAEAKR